MLGLDRGRLAARDALPAGAAARLQALVARRAADGCPVAYLTGRRGFRELELSVDERVLVPRPETELVIDVFEALLAAGRVPPGPLVDRGTGSGALALCAAAHRKVLALDRSAGALEVAARNLDTVRREHPGRQPVLLVRADGGGALRPGSVAAVLANPPYVAAADFDALPEDVRAHEPREALVPDGGDPGVMFSALGVEAASALRSGGWLVTEVGAGQAPDVIARLLAAGLEDPSVTQDLAGHERVVSARRPPG